MNNKQVQLLLYLLDEAFGSWSSNQNREKQSFLSNLRTVKRRDWLWVPKGGNRSICDITLHVGSCKYMYDNYAFGDQKLKWDDSLVSPWQATKPTIKETVKWLENGQKILKDHVSKLSDNDLPKPRKANWGEMKETRWLIKVLIEHDLYHAGEINHVRSINQKDDIWAYEKRGIETTVCSFVVNI